MPKFVAHAASKDHFERIKAERNDPTSQALPEPVLEPKTSAFARLGRHIYRAPTGFLLFAPILCIILMIAGANVAQIEDDVSKIWALKSGDYYKDMEYQESVQTTSTGSGVIAAVAIPREGGNVFSSAYIDEIVDRHNKTEGIEVGNLALVQIRRLHSSCANDRPSAVSPSCSRSLGLARRR